MPGARRKLGAVAVLLAIMLFFGTFAGQCGSVSATPTPPSVPPGAVATLGFGTPLPTDVALTPSGLNGTPVGSGVLGPVPTPYAGLVNPFSVQNQIQVEWGRAVYSSNCMQCHGPRGDGTGPAGIGLNPPPADFTKLADRFARTPDRQFWIVSEGFPGSSMPAWKARLSEEQRWQVITYESTLAASKE
jgi:mono/diheme cytochrome c family protein